LPLINRIIQKSAEVVPAWIEQVLGEMIRTGLIKILDFDPKEAARRNMKMSAVNVKYISRLE
jgi:hypothetical protein